MIYLRHGSHACNIIRMGDQWRARFREVLDTLNVSEYARAVGRPYRTVQDWRLGNRNPPPEALPELVDYLRTRSQAFAAAAQSLEAVAEPEAAEDADGQE